MKTKIEIQVKEVISRRKNKSLCFEGNLVIENKRGFQGHSINDKDIGIYKQPMISDGIVLKKDTPLVCYKA